MKFLRLVGCRHRHCYRERRELAGVSVLHWICPRCGRAVPIVKRSDAEYRALAARRTAGEEK
jgi:hypothetical protein